MRQEVVQDNYKIKRYILVLDAIVLILGIAGIFQVYHKSAVPLKLELRQDRLILSAQTVDARGIILPESMQLKSLDGIPLTSFEDLEFACDGLNTGRIVSAEFLNREEILHAELKLTRFYGWFYIIAAGSLALVVFAVGIIVLLKRPLYDKAALTFHGMMLAAFGMITMTWGSYIYPALWTGVLNRIIFSASYAIVPFFFLWFTFVFPREKTPHTLRIVFALSVIPVLLSAVLGYTAYHALSERSIDWFNRYEAWFDICRIFFAVSVIAGVGNFIHSFRKSADESERKKLKWIFFGTVTGPLSFILFWQIPQFFTSEGLVPEELILILVAVLPLTYGFSIVRYHIFDIDQIFRRSTIYGLSLLAVLGIYTVILGGAAMLIGQLTVINSVMLSAVSSVVTALLFQPLRERVKDLVDRRFFMVKVNFVEAQHQIAARLESATGIRQAAEMISGEIERFIPVKFSGLYIHNTHLPESGTLFCGDSEKGRNLEIISFIRSILHGQGARLPKLKGMNKETEIVHENLVLSSEDLQFMHAVIPFSGANEKIIACLILGEKKSEFPLSSEELNLILFSGNQFVMAVERIELEYNLRFEKEITARLKELNELKSFFVSSVSHDLKTPLTSIKLFAEILQDSKAGEEDRVKYLKIIQGETERLARLINNVLDFARIEKGIKEYSLDECNLTALVRSVVLMMQYQLQMNAFQTEEYYQEEDMPVYADKDAVTEACVNIIANAIRYSDKVKYLKVSVIREEKFITISFTDRGVGIPPEKRDEIFEPYKRLSNPLSKSSGGMGIGLAIVKHIADVHQGKVEAVPNEDAGTTFRFSLPSLSDHKKFRSGKRSVFSKKM
ncbi:MAG: Adaptive-response sensory-kinase SasA [Ignavibacteriaceae bacterium]|nr:Adaptive-response sensory-kinase SasA [Ignavibacteriaceae bacterium]